MVEYKTVRSWGGIPVDAMTQLKQSPDRRVGAKQALRALAEGCVTRAYVARDAEPSLVEPVLAACRAGSIEVFTADSMRELGTACGIDVAASVAVLIK